MIDNIFLESKLTGQTINKILIDDISDHSPTITILENLNPTACKHLEITSRDVRPKQLESLKKDLTSLLSSVTITGNTTEQFDIVHNIILESLDKHCPIRSCCVSSNRFRKEPWLTPGLLISCNKQKKLYQASICNNASLQIVERYKNYRNILSRLKRISKNNYYKAKCEEYKKDVRKLWCMINSCIGKVNDKTTAIDHLHVGNIDIFDSNDIANELGKYFSTIGSKYAGNIRNSKIGIDTYLKVMPRNTKSIYFAPTTSEEIRSLISKLPNKKSSGFDNIDNIILKEI